nr:MAG TPA: hypothetical protein [Caudoviricetes sp.]
MIQRKFHILFVCRSYAVRMPFVCRDKKKATQQSLTLSRGC